MPSSNRLIRCAVCKASIWTYNAEIHYSDCHPDYEIPEFVTAEEIAKKKKTWEDMRTYQTEIEFTVGRTWMIFNFPIFVNILKYMMLVKQM